MKKISYIVIFVTALTSCTSEKEQLVDDFLFNTIWEYNQINETPYINYDQSYFDNLSNILESYPNIKYTLEDSYYILQNDTIYHSGEYNTATLKFDQNICYYEDVRYQNITIEQYKISYQKYMKQ